MYSTKRNRKEIVMHLISIAGSAGTGKSTLINYLQENNRGYNFKVVDRKTSRSILRDWGITLQQVNSDIDIFKSFQLEMLSRKYSDDTSVFQTISDNDVIITERTFADLYTFALIIMGHNNEHNEWLNNYFNLCKQKQEIYDSIFLLPYGQFPIQSDDVRPNNEHFNLLWAKSIEEFTYKLMSDRQINVNVHKITDIDLKLRAGVVFEQLSKKQSNGII